MSGPNVFSLAGFTKKWGLFNIQLRFQRKNTKDTLETFFTRRYGNYAYSSTISPPFFFFLVIKQTKEGGPWSGDTVLQTWLRSKKSLNPKISKSKKYYEVTKHERLRIIL